jgi:hypothetical protein
LTPEEFHTAYPKVQTWIQKTLAAYEKDAQPIASMRSARLPLYFDHASLETAKFIPVDRQEVSYSSCGFIVCSAGFRSRQQMSFKPQRAGGRKRIYSSIPPPRLFIAATMDHGDASDKVAP